MQRHPLRKRRTWRASASAALCRGTSTNCETDDSTLLARAHNQFTVDLLKELAIENPSSNVFFSPTSIAAAFGMAYVGARGGSESELNSVFGHTDVGLTDRSRLITACKNLLGLSASPNVTLDMTNMVLALDRFLIRQLRTAASRNL
ncbi:hypothetical protein HPB51_001211 [Rhipicephalus microplus]|uniref:Serpin domain-containing protein n=1 Tax=Rhipicephalus microplus TaxID=6941 RepID=A0A9J6DRA0_RHIMP|nr:hypothetical protein HPB51_001211 [Rhipicephalus microplus]